MLAIYRLKASELNRDFLEGIKATFGDREIEITVSEFDETLYLFKSEANKKRLLQAIENVKEQQNLVEINLQDLP
jgi:antitoxin YefM